jgi:hypothetical protein
MKGALELCLGTTSVAFDTLTAAIFLCDTYALPCSDKSGQQGNGGDGPWLL